MAQLLQPMRQTPAMQALQSNLPAARSQAGDRRILPVNTVNREGIRKNVGEPVTRDPSYYQNTSLPSSTEQTKKVSDPKGYNDTGGSQQPTQAEQRAGTSDVPVAPRQEAPEAEDVNLEDLPGGERVETETLDENASVSGLLNQLMAEDSPYLQQARQRAAEAATARGLRNSTMAVESGEQAAIDRALPIAQQDAQQQYGLQQAAVNQRLTERRDLLLNELQQNRDTRTFGMDMQRLEQEFQNQISTMGVEMSHQNRTAYVQSSTELMNTAMEQVSMIYQNPNMNTEQQENAVRQVYRDLNKRMASLQSVYAPLPGVDFPEDEAQPSPVQPGRDVPLGGIDDRNLSGGGGISRGGVLGRNLRIMQR